MGQSRAQRAPDLESGEILTNEFASVRVSVDRRGHSPRLLVEDLEGGGCALLDPLELASFTEADDDDRIGWLLVGRYRPGADT
jgi:hypothetical protein